MFTIKFSKHVKKDIMDTYKPIDCGLYDEIELFAIKKIPVFLVYHSDQGTIIKTLQRILDTQTTALKEEYLILKNGTKVRMDRLISIEHISFIGSSSC